MFTVSQNQTLNFILKHLCPLRFRNVLFLKNSFYFFIFLHAIPGYVLLIYAFAYILHIIYYSLIILK